MKRIANFLSLLLIAAVAQPCLAAAASGAATTSTGAAADEVASKLNVLFIAVDDLRPSSPTPARAIAPSALQLDLVLGAFEGPVGWVSDPTRPGSRLDLVRVERLVVHELKSAWPDLAARQP
jgi:hypothetical protein